MIVSKRQVLILSTAVILLSLLYFYFDPTENYFPPCPLYWLTGLFCPGCGSQRAIHHLLHGDIAGAAGYNILLLVFLPVLALALLSALKRAFSNKGSSGPAIFYSPVFAWSVAVVVILFGILRNIPVYPFTLLSPH